MPRISSHILNKGAAKPIILAAIAILLATSALVAYLVISRSEGDASDPALPPAAESITELPIKWSAQTEQVDPVQITLTDKGPLLKRDALTIDLGLHIEGADPFEWETSRTDGNIILMGKSRVYDVPLSIQWAFKVNDPQVTLLVDLVDAPISALSSELDASLTLPPDTRYEAIRQALDIQIITSPTTLGSWTPGWLKAQIQGNDQATLTFSEWDFGALDIDPDAPQHQLTFSLWDPGSSPSFEACEASGTKTISLRRRLTMTLGERLPLVPSRYQGGYRAAIAPLFIDPASHEVKRYKDGRAKSAQDWVQRSKTLLYGHSSEQDPRFGNGGLLGLGLGADIAMETSWHEAPEVAALSTQLANSRARHLARSPNHEHTAGQGYLLAEPSCKVFMSGTQPYLTLGAARSMDQLDILTHPPTLKVNGQEVSRQHANLSPEFAPHLEVPQLSGSRQALTDAVFSTQALDALIAQRGMKVFATPLIATRNPLTPSASQALLEPERGGHWTLSEPLSRALTNVELLGETNELLVTSPTLLMQHWQHARQVRILEMPDGSVAIINPLDTAIEGFTLLARGNLDPSLPEGQALTGQEVVTARDGSSQTWLWWTLPPGTTRLTLSQDAGQSALAPVKWELQE